MAPGAQLGFQLNWSSQPARQLHSRAAVLGPRACGSSGAEAEAGRHAGGPGPALVCTGLRSQRAVLAAESPPRAGVSVPPWDPQGRDQGRASSLHSICQGRSVRLSPWKGGVCQKAGCSHRAHHRGLSQTLARGSSRGKVTPSALSHKDKCGRPGPEERRPLRPRFWAPGPHQPQAPGAQGGAPHSSCTTLGLH